MTKIFRLKPIKPNMITQDEGFSLLEILVVLAIMGLLLSVVSVRMFAMIDSTRFIRETELALSALKAHRAEALLRKHPVLIVTDTPDTDAVKNINSDYIRTFTIEETWSVEGPPVKITSGGVCTGGPLTFKDNNGREISYSLALPNCQPERIIEPDSGSQF